MRRPGKRLQSKPRNPTVSATAATGSQRAHVDMWLRAPALGDPAFGPRLALPTAQQAAVMLELSRMYGNTAVQRSLVRTPASRVIQREGAENPGR